MQERLPIWGPVGGVAVACGQEPPQWPPPLLPQLQLLSVPPRLRLQLPRKGPRQLHHDLLPYLHHQRLLLLLLPRAPSLPSSLHEPLTRHGSFFWSRLGDSVHVPCEEGGQAGVGVEVEIEGEVEAGA